jgi:hypothetical protein
MARSSGKGLKVNPVSLMETIYNFVSFSGEVIADFKEALETLYVQNDFENLHLNGEKVYLSTSKACSFRHEIGEALSEKYFLK